MNRTEKDVKIDVKEAKEVNVKETKTSDVKEVVKEVIVITGGAGDIGTSLANALKNDYAVVSMDQPGKTCDIEIDLTSSQSVELAMRKLKQKHGDKLAAVVHLAAYFDFTGKRSPLYEKVNEQGTKRLLDALQAFTVERFVYSSTMLVHQSCKPGESINEQTLIDPQWAYPISKAKTEKIIHQHHGKIPYLILRLAGLYDDESAVPTLSQQIVRIYERRLKSLFYSGNILTGQTFIHREDVISLFKSAIERRHELPETLSILAGEPEPVSYDTFQNLIGQLVHGTKEWDTMRVPKPIAKAGAWIQEKSEPVVPDDFDQGEKPFIRPFMIDLASQHYALDISLARQLLNWEPKHRVKDTLPEIIQSLKRDPVAWYERNGITLPEWMQSAEQKQINPERLRTDYEDAYHREHEKNLWAGFINIFLGGWLMTAPAIMGYESTALMFSDVISGAAVIILGFISLSPQKWFRFSRYCIGLIGLWVLCAPLVLWAPDAVSYLNDTLVGTLLLAFSLLIRPFPGISPVAALSGPVSPPGWDFSPSSWFQRLPIIFLAVIGFFISRYLAAYQLGHIEGVWEPFFSGSVAADEKNGTEEIITSYVSDAWPVPDAGAGSVVYLLEIITGLIGSRTRWRTMPWLVLFFGFLIIPLGAVSITFIIIQPILLDTWCTLCLIAAAVMLLQIPYSFDEIVATLSFLRRRYKAGRPVLRILFSGDTDEDEKTNMTEDNFNQPVTVIVRDILKNGISVPWSLGVSALIGVWLMLTRLTLGATGNVANVDHLIGSLVLTFSVTAFAEVIRPIRFMNIFLGMTLLITPFLFGASFLLMISELFCGLALILLSLPRGPVNAHYGTWEKAIV